MASTALHLRLDDETLARVQLFAAEAERPVATSLAYLVRRGLREVEREAVLASAASAPARAMPDRHKCVHGNPPYDCPQADGFCEQTQTDHLEEVLLPDKV